jgi:hypothetical protein
VQEDVKCLGLAGELFVFEGFFLSEVGYQEIVGWILDKVFEIVLV